MILKENIVGAIHSFSFFKASKIGSEEIIQMPNMTDHINYYSTNGCDIYH